MIKLGLLKYLRKFKIAKEQIYRDFSTDEENRLLEMADDGDDIVQKYVVDTVVRWLDKQGIPELILDSEKYKSTVLEIYNIDRETIKKVFQQARNLDSLYGGKMMSLRNQMNPCNVALKELAECFTNCGDLHDNIYVINVSDSWKEMEKNSFQYNQPVSDNDVKVFCTNNENTVLSKYSDDICQDIWGCKTAELSGTIFILDSSLTKKTLAQMIDSIIDTKKTHQNFAKDHKYAKEYMKKMLDDYQAKDKKKFESENPGHKYSDLEKFITAVGGVEVYKMMLDKCPGWLDYLFTDYSEGIDILDSVEEFNGSNLTPEMNKALVSLREEYETKWKGFISKSVGETLDFVKENGGKEIEKWIKDKYKDSDILFSMIDVADVETSLKGRDKLAALAKMAKDSEQALNNATEKIRSGTYTDDDLTAVRHLFELSKQANIEMYEAYKDVYASDASKRAYANGKLQELKNMEINQCSSYRVN